MLNISLLNIASSIVQSFKNDLNRFVCQTKQCCTSVWPSDLILEDTGHSKKYRLPVSLTDELLTHVLGPVDSVLASATF